MFVIPRQAEEQFVARGPRTGAPVEMPIVVFAGLEHGTRNGRTGHKGILELTGLGVIEGRVANEIR